MTVNDVRPGEALEQQSGDLPENGMYGWETRRYVDAARERQRGLALAKFAV